MTETTWTHIGIMAVPSLMILGFWLDSRRTRQEEERRAAERHQAEEQKATARHTENVTRLTAIETQIKPIWEAWNKRGFGMGD